MGGGAYTHILTLGTLVSATLGDGVGIATAGSFGAGLAVAVSATLTFSKPGIDASCKGNVASLLQFAVVCVDDGGDNSDDCGIMMVVVMKVIMLMVMVMMVMN